MDFQASKIYGVLHVVFNRFSSTTADYFKKVKNLVELKVCLC